MMTIMYYHIYESADVNVANYMYMYMFTESHGCCNAGPERPEKNHT